MIVPVGFDQVVAVVVFVSSFVVNVGVGAEFLRILVAVGDVGILVAADVGGAVVVAYVVGISVAEVAWGHAVDADVVGISVAEGAGVVVTAVTETKVELEQDAPEGLTEILDYQKSPKPK